MAREFARKTRKRIYRGRNLLQIALPLGGIGTGCICLNGHGGLQDFSIRHAPATTAMPDAHAAQDAGFALLHLPAAGITRLLEGPMPVEKIYNLGLKSQGYNGGGFEGLPRLRECSFTGEYPFGTARLSDPDLPLRVHITGFNPFIPLDDINSGIPCAILEYTLENRSAGRVPYQFSYHLSHLAQKGAESTARSAALPGLGVYFWNEEQACAGAHGSAALAVLGVEPSIKARWLRGGWFDAISALWREVATGQFQPADGLTAGSQTGRNGGSVWVPGTLNPGEQITLPVVIAWHFPNIVDPTCPDERCCSNWHPFYATQWKDARAVLEYVAQHYRTLRSRTQAFHDAFFGSDLPPVVLEAVSANLAILKSPTVLRYENGDIWAWEGCFCDRGCCAGSCTHVWNYAQAMPHLFPALERTLREAELERAMDARGHVNFRVAPPKRETAHDFHAAADGQLGGILKVYREWQIAGDREWLTRMYPLAKRSMDFCIEHWDPRQVGLVEEPHHNTYDIEFWGADGMCSSFYLGALTAMAALARDAGESAGAGFYEDLARKGAQAMERRLFNGEYYQQQVQYTGLRDTSFAEMLAGLGEDLSAEQKLLQAEGPKYQYGSGCLSDGVLGAWLAGMCGLETPLSREHIRQHLQAVFRHNFKPALGEHANCQRPGFALGDEPGLLLCTWPRGGKPTLPFVYSDEVWTGIEYQLAAHLIMEGLLDQGLTVVKGARSRYDGHTRNPWNEYECGNYYARAMSSYGLLLAFSGFGYSAATRTLKLAPKVEGDFHCFFSTASGWGTFTLRQKVVALRLIEGSLAVETLTISRAGRLLTYQPGVTLHAGERRTIRLEP